MDGHLPACVDISFVALECDACGKTLHLSVSREATFDSQSASPSRAELAGSERTVRCCNDGYMDTSVLGGVTTTSYMSAVRLSGLDQHDIALSPYGGGIHYSGR